MRLFNVLMLLLSVGVALSLGGCCNPHKWRTIEVETSYTEAGGLTINTEDAHDIGVSGPEDTLSWKLNCEGCPEGTEWRITDWQMVADLHALTDGIVEVFQDPERGLLESMEATEVRFFEATPVAMETPEGEVEEVEAREDSAERREAEVAADLELARRFRIWLGIKSLDPSMDVAREAFELIEPGWTDWAAKDQSIKATSKRDKSDKADELWKWAVEIRVPGYDDSLPCNLDPETGKDDLKRACWDPHNFNHPRF